MDKKQKLYVRNDKGRYEPYREPEPPFDNMLYRKVRNGNKVGYDPYSMLLSEELGEGVWVVTKHTYGKSFSNGKYLNDCFMCFKASDIQEVSLAKLGGMDKLADYLSHNWEKVQGKSSLYERCQAIVGLLFQYEKEKGEKQ